VSDAPVVTTSGNWQRLHPLSPLARLGRLVPLIFFGLVVSLYRNKASGGSEEIYYVLAVGILTPILGVVHWLVTRWKIEGDTLRIETGLIKRDSRRLPLTRIQAVDIVRPLMARMLGISELRIRLAGSGSTDGRLAYLSEAAALELRHHLLSEHREDQAAVFDASVEHPMAKVGTGRLVGSVLLSGVSLVLLAAVLALLVLDDVAPRTAAAATGILLIYLVGLATWVWRRISTEYHFEAVEAPEGVRIRPGLLATTSETVPFARIQAVRQIEPLFWRPLGWCRLEVDIAGGSGRNQRGEGAGVARKVLLPVGTQQEAWLLVDRLIGGSRPPMTAPPRQARAKAPLSFHFLSAGHDDRRAVCVTGRLREVTAWVPLEKAQSVRRTQGPVQRRLGLASVHVDVAGRGATATFRDRSVEESDHLLHQLADLSRSARHHPVSPPAVRTPSGNAGVPPGWYPDPSGRHQLRYWSEDRWTEHVSDGGATALDSPA
jgi:putative membrane protein